VNVRISFNCFSSVEWCKVCTQNARSALTGSVSVLKLRRDNTKLSLCKECKETGARHAQSSARIQTLRKDLVQGVHRSKIRLSVEGTLQEVEEPEKENARRARGISLQEILWI
jgi:hypothetical protein